MPRIKTRIVPSSELSSKSLRARDYVLQPYRVTWNEVVGREVTIYTDMTNPHRVANYLADMPDDEKRRLLMQGERKIKKGSCIMIEDVRKVKEK